MAGSTLERGQAVPDPVEALRLARDRILADRGDFPFSLGDWNTCTCGHVYSAVTGSVVGVPGKDHFDGVVQSDDHRDSVYDEALRLVIAGNGEKPRWDPSDWHSQVSDMTIDTTRGGSRRWRIPPEVQYRSAVTLLDNAISYGEGEQRKAMEAMR